VIQAKASKLSGEPIGADLQCSERRYEQSAGRFSAFGRGWRSRARLQGRRVIFREGDPAQELFIVQSGEVEIRLGNRLLETLPQYSIFGEMALIDSAPRSATAIAATDVRLVAVSEKQFLFLISNTPYFALNVMRVMARRLRVANTAL
jgi:CRP/FNR family transcriptional regulator, cyclic AMP receptor protein